MIFSSRRRSSGESSSSARASAVTSASASTAPHFAPRRTTRCVFPWVSWGCSNPVPASCSDGSETPLPPGYTKGRCLRASAVLCSRASSCNDLRRRSRSPARLELSLSAHSIKPARGSTAAKHGGFGRRLSVVSLSLAAWVNDCGFRCFAHKPLGLLSVSENCGGDLLDY